MLPNLRLITAGPLPPNPANLLSLDRMRMLMAELRESVDVILIDCPPVLAVSDPLIISSLVDARRSSRSVAKPGWMRCGRQPRCCTWGAPRIIGVVLNQQGDHSDGGYYYQDYNALPEGQTGFRRRSGKTAATHNPAGD